MRIVILSDRIPPENKGGAEVVAWSLALGLQHAGHEVHVITTTEGSPTEEIRAGIATYSLHARYPERWRAWLSLYNPQTIGPLRYLLERIRPDVVNAHNIHTYLSYTSLSLAHRMRIPAVFTAHDVMPFAYTKARYFINPVRCGVESLEQYRLPPFFNLRQMRLRYNPLRNLNIRYILRQHVQVRVSVSDSLRQALEANGLPPFRVVHNGVNPARFDAPQAVIDALRQRLDLTNRVVILFAGRITADKGSKQLLAALARVVEHVPNALLLILTTRDLQSQGFGEPAYAHLLENHVRQGGWLAGDDLAAAYRLANVVTSPSIIMDSAGMVNLEGMAAARPLVATCYGGASELVLDGQTGYIINPYDIETFADRLIRLLLDPDLQERMGNAGQRRLLDNFSLSIQTTKMLQVYQDAAQEMIRDRADE